MYRIGVDLGGTNIAVGLVDEDGQIQIKKSTPTIISGGPHGIISDIVRTIHEIISISHIQADQIEYIGLGIPGFIDVANGSVLFAGNLKWSHVPIVTELENRLPYKCYIENDGQCALLGEYYAGSAKGYRNVIMLLLGTGVGSGMIINNEIYSGSDHMGCEIGHVVLDFHGSKCACGGRGCVETLVSATALINQAKISMEKHPETILHELTAKSSTGLNGQIFFQAIVQKDIVALAVLEQYVKYLAATIGSCIAVFRPDIVLLGGGLSGAGSALLDPVNHILPEYMVGSSVLPCPQVKRAILGNDAGIIGAAMLHK